MKIPVGDFGNAVARPAAAAPISADAYGAQQGASLVQVGQGLQQVGAELGRYQQDLNRIKSIRAMAEAKNSLYSLEDEITQGIFKGEIDPADAQKVWQDRSTKLVADRLQGVNSEHRELVSAQLLDTSNSLAGRVRDAATKRTQQNIGGELTALGSELEREAVRDRAGANAKYETSVRSMGPQAGMTPAQIETAVQKFKESSANTVAYTALHAARNNGQALNEFENRLASDEFADLDPQRRAVLASTAAGYRTTIEQRAVAAAQRAEIAAQRRERQAGSMFQDIYGLAVEGKKIDPEFAAQAAQAMQGTSYERMLPKVLAAAPEGTAFAMQPLTRQQQALQAWAAEGNASGWTPQKKERYDLMQRSYDASVRDFQQDPLPAAVQRGVLQELAPLDVSRGVAGLAQGLAERALQARQVETYTGRATSPFTMDEAKQVAQLLQALPNDQKATAMASIADTIGPRGAGALAAQIDTKDRALALAAGFGPQRAGDGGLIAERILSGKQAIEDKTVKVDEQALAGWKAQISKRVRGAYSSPELEDAIIDSAYYLYADQQQRRAGSSFDKAIEAASGGIVERNGGKIPLPYGLNERGFNKAVAAITAENLAGQAPDGKVYLNGQAVPLADFVKGLPDARLRHAGQGLYTISTGTTSALNSEGRPIMLNITSAPPAPAKPKE